MKRWLPWFPIILTLITVSGVLWLWPGSTLSQVPPDGIHYGQAPRPLPEVKMLLAGEAFDVESAMTQSDLLQGLMYRNSIPEKHGMLFPFYPPRAVTFWMKNTRVPLDMLFMRNKTIVNIVHSAPPCTSNPCPTFDSIVPVDMVIELPGGTAEKLNIDLGDIVQFESKNKSQPNTATKTQTPDSNQPDSNQPVDVFPVESSPESVSQ